MTQIVVYKIKNIISEKIYIGSTKHKEKRKSEHFSRLRCNRHSNQHLQRAWNKHGMDAFEFSVIKDVGDESKLERREQYYIDKLEPEYNIRPKADRSKVSESTKVRISKSLKGHTNSIERRKKISRGLMGRKLNKETKRKISKTLTGNKLDKEVKEKISKALSGRVRGEKVKRKISETLQGHEYHKLSETGRQKLSEAARGENGSLNKLTQKKVKVIKYLLKGDSFTQEEISKMYDVTKGCITHINTGRNWNHINIP